MTNGLAAICNCMFWLGFRSQIPILLLVRHPIWQREIYPCHLVLVSVYFLRYSSFSFLTLSYALLNTVTQLKERCVLWHLISVWKIIFSSENGECETALMTKQEQTSSDWVMLSDGCPNDCNGHGSCHLFASTWICRCRDGWKGSFCDIAMEIDCEGERDEDDGLYSVRLHFIN